MKTKKVEGSATLNNILHTIGKYLINLRRKKGFSSHATFAKSFDLPRIQYLRMEKGKANLTLKSLHRILQIHNVSIEDFFWKILRDRRKRKGLNGR